MSNYKIEIHNKVGTYTWFCPTNVKNVEYLIVGGGGGGGGAYDTGAGGGGGGGMVISGSMNVSYENTYSLIVGDGGNGSFSNYGFINETDGSNGDFSQFHTKKAYGGMGGYRSHYYSSGIGQGGIQQNLLTLTSPTAGNGGVNVMNITKGSSGGGGGSGGNGTDGLELNAGIGGDGITSFISGTLLEYGKGGNGQLGNKNIQGNDGLNGYGNGGDGASSTYGISKNGGKGGSGVVILKYQLLNCCGEAGQDNTKFVGYSINNIGTSYSTLGNRRR